MQYHHTTYARRRGLLTVAGVLLAAVGLSTSIDAGTASKRTIVTISHTMALPGATLPPGTYEFEVLNPGSTADVVAVTGRTGPRVRFLGLTRRVDRPRTMPRNQSLVFGEAPAGQPIPISAWYPIGYSTGHQFIY